MPPIDCDLVDRTKQMGTLSLSIFLFDGFPLNYCEAFEGECLMLHNYMYFHAYTIIVLL